MDLPGKILKICKIDNLSFGKFAILSGADYLGVHILEEKDIGKRVDLVKKLLLLGGDIVIVTKIAEPSQLEKIINLYTPKALQFHFAPNIDLIKTLKKAHSDLEIFSVITNELKLEVIEQASGLSDKIIYDTSYVGGTGEKHHLDLLEKLNSITKSKLLIAGGITLEFLMKYKDFDVAGFDIQSYFRENNSFHYDRLGAISRLIKGPKRGMLSVSITDLESVDVCVDEYEKSSHYDYHLDYSDGSLYEDFITDKQQTLKKIGSTKGVPISIHIFNKNEEKIRKLMDEFMGINGNSISSFFVQYFSGIDLSKINEKNFNLVISIYYKDLGDYLRNWHNYTDYLSIILPSDDVKRTQIILDYIKQNQWFFKKEIWFDRELDSEKIKYLKNNLDIPFNAIVGKAITKNKNSINEIYEQLSV